VRRRLAAALGAVALIASAAPVASALPQWPQFRGNAQGTGQTAAYGPNRVKGVSGWPVNLGATVQNVVVGNNGTVYAAAGSKLYALTPSARPVWTFSAPSGSSFASAPAVTGGGTVYALSFQPQASGEPELTLTSISPQGRLNWQQTAGASFGSGTVPNVTLGPDGTVYASASAPGFAGLFSGTLVAYNALGEQTWSAALPFATSAPVVGPTGTAFVVGPSFVAAVAPGGAVLWTNSQISGGHGPTVGADNRVYVANGTALTALNGATGAVVWSTPIPSATGPTSLAPSGVVYVPTSGGLAAVSSGGAVQFVQDEPGSGLGSTPINDTAGNLYFGAGDSFDATNAAGDAIWTTPTRAAGQSPAMASNGTLYVPDSTLLRAYAGP
jgi:hypothetical protein